LQPETGVIPIHYIYHYITYAVVSIPHHHQWWLHCTDWKPMVLLISIYHINSYINDTIQ